MNHEVLRINITNEQSALRIDRRRIRAAVRAILDDHGFTSAIIGIAIVDDEAISRLHGQYLQNPDPTDVLSFLLESADAYLEGEVAVSAETALATARRLGAQADEELLRYVIHGMLHLVGYDDRAPKERAAIRRQERFYLKK
jgi:probable rRNA maturation factor